MTWASIVEYVSTQMQTNQFFSAAALASAATAALMSLKSLPLTIWKRIRTLTEFNATVYQSDDLYYYISAWLAENRPNKLRNVEFVTRVQDDYYEDDSPGDETPLKALPINDYFYMWRAGRLLTVSSSKEKLENANSLRNAFLKSYTFSGLFAKKAITNLMNEIKDQYELAAKKKCFLYTSSEYGWSKAAEVSGKALKSVVINKDLKADLLQDIRSWWDSKDWYEQRNISHKRGHLYYGPPGTGKTTLSRAIALELKMSLYSLTLDSVSEKSLKELLTTIPYGSILLMEDIDSVFHKRKCLLKGSQLTFSAFLNALDGVVSLNGLFVIMTSNHIENLDPALIRPGRIDRQILISNAGRAEVVEYLSAFYELEFENKVFPEDLSLPMSEVQNVCLQNIEDSATAYHQILELCSTRQSTN
jgi:chaperone BCS1